ncbi:MAG: hypothetical protein SGPRY_013482, partial [Prymnesium sp.]
MASAEEEVLRQRLLAKETSLRQLTRHYLSFVESVESSTAEQVAAAHANLLKEITAYEFSVSKAGMLVDTNLRQICEYDEMQQKIDAEIPVFFHASAIHSSAYATLVLSIYTHPLSCATTVFTISPVLTSFLLCARHMPDIRRRPDATICAIVCAMASTHSDIESLSGRLQEERLLRQQREQYAVLARRINAYPSREQTQAEIAGLNAEIDGLEQERDSIASKLEQRSKRFAGFLHSLHDLQMQ